MSSDNTPPTDRKNAAVARAPEPPMKCPRCDSPNTKFCYYNNYSLTQPRHFCKTCRRYWTKGGALRNVPIGGGCRKNRKMKSFSRDSVSSSSDMAANGGLKFFHGINGIHPPAIDFHLGSGSGPGTGALSFHNNFPSANSFADVIPSVPNFNFDVPASIRGGAMMGMNFTNEFGSNIASSIESLSSMNQDLHWKLQQQRLATLFGNGNGNQNQGGQSQRLQPIMFQNLDRKIEDGNTGAVATEWYFDNSYAPPAVNPTPTNSGSNENGGNWINGIQGWNDHMNHYSGLP